MTGLAVDSVLAVAFSNCLSTKFNVSTAGVFGAPAATALGLPASISFSNTNVTGVQVTLNNQVPSRIVSIPSRAAAGVMRLDALMHLRH
jgi:hypothetical protein